MTRIPLTALAALSVLVATTAPARAYEGWQVGTWTHTATVDKHQVKVTLDVTANTIHCTVRAKEGPTAWTITAEADYVMSRDGIMVGILAPGKVSPKDEKNGVEERAFTCRITAEKNALVVSDLKGGRDEDLAKQMFEGRYRKVEAKTTPTRGKSREPVVTPTSPSPSPPSPASSLAPPRDAEDTASAAKASFGPPDPTRTVDLTAARTSVRFTGPKGLKVAWRVEKPDGEKAWGDEPLEAPATYNFAQAAVYRLKLSDIPDNPDLKLYPTLEVVPANSRTKSFLAHNSVPVGFTGDDFRAAKAGNSLVKVIYLPNEQDGVGELVATQLEPSADPIAEATKRGSILAVIRLGNTDPGQKGGPSSGSPLLPAIKPPSAR